MTGSKRARKTAAAAPQRQARGGTGGNLVVRGRTHANRGWAQKRGATAAQKGDDRHRTTKPGAASCTRQLEKRSSEANEAAAAAMRRGPRHVRPPTCGPSHVPTHRSLSAWLLLS